MSTGKNGKAGNVTTNKKTPVNNSETVDGVKNMPVNGNINVVSDAEIGDDDSDSVKVEQVSENCDCESLRSKVKELQEINEKLKSELDEMAKKCDMNLKNIIKVFNELQSNHLKYGKNFVIYPVAFMNRLVMFFPFLSEYKKY